MIVDSLCRFGWFTLLVDDLMIAIVVLVGLCLNCCLVFLICFYWWIVVYLGLWLFYTVV